MPKQCLPTPEAFEIFSNELKKRKFLKTSARDLRVRFPRLRLIAPRSIDKSEIGFQFSRNDLTVIVWTTWIESEGRARKNDSGWILILNEQGTIVYSSRPLHRTKNFLENLSMQARIARWRVLHRPHCTECNRFMNIVCGKGIKARFWQCAKKGDHKTKKSCFAPFDQGLPQEAIDYLAPRRKQHRKTLCKIRAGGKIPFTAMHRRKRWQRG